MVQEGIHIKGTVSLTTLQRHFSEMFPYLSIRFFKNNRELNLEKTSLLIQEVTRKAIISDFWIVEHMKVSELEELFRKKMDLEVHIYRKLGNSWIETSFTNDWTLERQNQRGKDLFDRW